ncbi:hypothetical protein ACERK3_12540 [Phycisphaerales bacterium AB-hyl4]|uniref:Uncharacterized protein n=1 Tax=Natronomicrosphaera hydrolytica TaxID=3242702 RepID=A0ABV4U8G7_9BACT
MHDALLTAAPTRSARFPFRPIVDRYRSKDTGQEGVVWMTSKVCCVLSARTIVVVFELPVEAFEDEHERKYEGRGEAVPRYNRAAAATWVE